MDRKSIASRLSLLLLLGLAFGAPLPLAAQVPVDENGEPLAALEDEGIADEGYADEAAPSLTTAELEELVGPVALYPDDLLAIVLPASTYPLEIVEAARFLDELEQDGSLEPDESWDESVVALLNYPEVVRMMDRDIDWTWRLGEAVISQQADVIAAVETFRDRAYAAGNLESDEHQTVSNDDGVIEIDPVDEEIIYVPYYEPEEVVVYQPRRVYYYYPRAYPLYYYPYPYGYSFASGYFWGVTTAYTIGWSNYYLNVYHPSYWGHPYYGSYYYGHYYRRPSITVYNNTYVHGSYGPSTHHYRDGDHWRPRQHHSGARPATRSVRNRHYPSDGTNNYRADHGSRGHTGQDTRDRNRASSRGNRPGSASNDRQTLIPANDVRQGSRSGADRGSTGSTIRFRDRSAGAAGRSVPGNGSGRSSSAGQQRLTARNVRPSTSFTGNSDDRQRSAVARQPATRTSFHDAGQRPGIQRTVRRQAPVQRQANRATVRSQATRPTVQRQANRTTVRSQATRPTVQRQAPAQRQATRAAVQRQASVQKAARSAAPQRQAPARRAAPSSGRGQSNAGAKRQASSSRGNARRERAH